MALERESGGLPIWGGTLEPKAMTGLSMEALAFREKAAQWTNGEEQKRSAKVE